MKYITILLLLLTKLNQKVTKPKVKPIADTPGNTNVPPHGTTY